MLAPTPASQRGLAQARAALAGEGASIPPEEALRIQAHYRAENEAQRTGQASLPLEPIT